MRIFSGKTRLFNANFLIFSRFFKKYQYFYSLAGKRQGKAVIFFTRPECRDANPAIRLTKTAFLPYYPANFPGRRPEPITGGNMKRKAMPYELKIETSFAAAHNLLNYCGQCENLHGHNWKIEVVIRGDTLDQSGMLLDFKILKEEVNAILDRLDHTYLNENPAFAGRSPSSELIARHIFTTLEKGLDGRGVTVTKVVAWESERAAAAYTRN